ncbi:MAG: endonuclease/exonuclease/phosphatase [Chlorobaculum sp.]|jgi:predicted extracellular nuclease|nr:endonuclease/exonuclease/phosphatase [Chlorobaculum sp.]
MQNNLFIAFWNVENLFDVDTTDRPEKIKKIIKKDIAGWDDTILSIKLAQLSKVIRSMNSSAGPDILGVCEIENRNVLEKLVAKIAGDGGRAYQIAHADTSDNRGIDVAFLYDPAIASTSPSEMFQHWIMKRYATREIFQVNFHIDDKIIVLVGNHWPSRTAGEYESEPYRIIAGETLAYWIQRIKEELGKEVAIVVLGDFNDEPFNRSIKEYALSINDKKRVKNGRNPYLLNLMWPMLAEGVGSHYYGSQWNMLDQIMISRGIINGKSGWKQDGNVQIEAVSLMSIPKKTGPRRFGLKQDERDTEGFSDHYPVSIKLKR